MIIQKVFAATALGVAGIALTLGSSWTSLADDREWQPGQSATASAEAATAGGGFTVDGVRIH